MDKRDTDTYEEDLLDIIKYQVAGEVEEEAGVKAVMENIRDALQEAGRLPLTWTRKPKETDKDFIDRIVNTLGDDVLPAHDGTKVLRKNFDHPHYYIPKNTERVVAAPFGHCCQNCGGAEHIITFLKKDKKKGWAVLSSLYADMG